MSDFAAASPACSRPRFDVLQRRSTLSLILALATLALYWPATHCDFLNFDDPLYVTANPHIRAGITWSGLKWVIFKPDVQYGYWHPVTLLSHMLDSQLFGLNPWGHHFTSMLLHAFNTVLVFLLLGRLTGATWRSAMVAALFAFHPLHVESVAWVSERKDVLSAFFGLLSLCAYSRYAAGGNIESTYAKASVDRHRTRTGKIWYGLALGFFALGLMSKPMLVTLPFVMLLLDYWPLGRSGKCEVGSTFAKASADRSAKAEPDGPSTINHQPSTFWRLVAEKIPFFALVAVMSCVTFAMSREGGALGGGTPLNDRVGNAVVAYCRYLGKIFWPARLAVFYPHPGQWSGADVLAACVCLIAISALFFVLRRQHPFLLVGWLWFVGMLVPVIGLVQVGEFGMADRYAYLPVIGVFLLVTWEAGRLWERFRLPGAAATVPAAVILAACVVTTRGQLGYWKNTETLFTHSLGVTKDNAPAHDVLGYYYFRLGRVNDAIAQYEDALRVEPTFYQSYDNLGFARYSLGEVDAAMTNYVRALQLHPRFPNCLNNLGTALMSRGRYTNAMVAFEAALKINPDFADAHANLGGAFFQTGDMEGAMREAREALSLMPDNSRANNNLANVLVARGDVAEAVAHYRLALQSDPNFLEALCNLGYVLSAEGQYADSIDCYERALKLKPDDAQLHCDLGEVLAKAGRTDEAAQRYAEALRLKPGLAAARDGLKALGETGAK